MKLLITGASGFVAQQIIPHLRAAGVDLVLVSRDVATLQARYSDCASGTYEEWDRLAPGADAVLHLAAKNNDEDGDAEAFMRVNSAFLQEVLDKTKASGIPLLIFTSSLKARSGGAAQDHYGRSKEAAEVQLQSETGLAVHICQLAAVYGESFAGNLAIVTKFPAAIRPFLLQVLGTIRPTLSAKTLSDEILRVMADPRSDHKILTNGQKGNLVFAGFKRGLDLLFVAVIGVLFFWLLAVVWAAVKFTSSGPGIFAQERVGRNGKSFTCYKFRTMQQGTKQAGTHEVAASSTTRVGAFLRKTKLDELPQILNLLKGEMSLIGPRPCLPSQTELVDARTRLGVLDVRPGISGLSQIRNIDMSTPLKLARSDAEYIALRTIPMELKIILATATGSGQGDKIQGTTGEQKQQ